ncbi:hypothetical protein ACROYT_G031800 [Oculina patagonica]
MSDHTWDFVGHEQILGGKCPMTNCSHGCIKLVLFRHVLSGEITVDRLVRMTPEQLASPELATWREQETKHTLEMIRMNQEEINASKAHIKKTHKGEVEIDDDDLSTLENSVQANDELKVEKGLPDSNTSSSILLLDTTDEHRIHLFDLNCRICTGKMAPPGEPPRRETPAPLVSTTSIVQAVAESSIPSPTPMDIVTSASSPDSGTVTQPPVSPSVLSKTQKKIPAVWKGFVMMQSVAKFGTSAYRVSGSCDNLLQLLPDTLHVQGRIAHEQVWDYLLQLKNSTSREVCVIRYEASSDDEKLSYVSLYSYFYSRKRCGVVSNCYTGVKDMYLVPLASHQPIPPELLPFDGPGLDEPRPHMLLGVIVRSKAVFKRPRALSQRSLSPPPKRRTSSASIETSSSEGGTVDSPASKRSVLSELHDSPPADIDDIVFQYNTTQAKIASKETKDSPAKASPASETSTPSMTSSSGAVTSPSVSTDMSSVASLEAQKKQLLDLQERARQYILAQTQRKGTASGNEEPQGVSEDKEAPDTANVKLKGGESKVADDDDAPYDPEEGLELDLNPTDPTPAKPAVPVTSEESPKPSSFQMLVSTLQRLQSAAVKSVSPHLAALSTVLPLGSTAASSETTAAATASTASQATISPGNGIQSVASTGSILQPVVPASRDLQSVSSPNNTSQPIAYSSHEPQFSSMTDKRPTAFGSSGHLLQHSGPSDHQAVSANRHIPQPSPGHTVQPSGVAKQQPMSVGGHTPHPSGAAGRQPVSSSGRIMQPSGVADQQPMPVGGHTPHSSGAAGRQPVSSSGRIMQPSGVADQQPMSVGGRVVHNDPTVGRGPQSSSSPDRQPVSIGSTVRMPQPDVSTRGGVKSPTSHVHHHSTSSGQSFHSRPPSDQRQQLVPHNSGHTNRWNPSEPPQVTRHVNDVTQQTGQEYSGLRPEERARLAAHESRMESRENRRVPSEHRDEHYEQRRMDDRHRGGWYNETRFPRDSRPGDSNESRFPRDSRASDSRSDWRHQHRPGRQWYDDEQRRDRHEYPVDERPRYEERREERRFKEHWSRDRWRR